MGGIAYKGKETGKIGRFALLLYSAIMEAASGQVAEYLGDFEDARPERCMAGLDANAAEEIFQALTANSAFYIAVQRLGLPIPDDIDAEMYEDIRYFDTWATQMAVGEASHSVAETVLRQIERSVKGMERETTRWIAQQHGGLTGYVSKNYVKAVSASLVREVVKCKSYVSLREEPSGSSPRLKKLPLGTLIEYLVKAENGYAKVHYENQIGYVMTQYLKKPE